MAERYREISFTRQLENGDDPYEADMRVVFHHNGRSYRRILSRVRPGVYADVLMEGDPVLYEKRLIKEKRIMASFDDRNQPGRPILKTSSSIRKVPCPACHGEGEAPDRHGNWRDCKQCDATGFVDS